MKIKYKAEFVDKNNEKKTMIFVSDKVITKAHLQQAMSNVEVLSLCKINGDK